MEQKASLRFHRGIVLLQIVVGLIGCVVEGGFGCGEVTQEATLESAAQISLAETIATPSSSLVPGGCGLLTPRQASPQAGVSVGLVVTMVA